MNVCFGSGNMSSIKKIVVLTIALRRTWIRDSDCLI
jgi:hypothetical protein